MKKVGFVGWRGMVGSVLINRMLEEKDFENIEKPIFFTTSQVGEQGPKVGKKIPLLRDAFDINLLSEMDVIVTCQGSSYTKKVYKGLRDIGWDGYWIDAASELRMIDSSVIVLDPINREVIDSAILKGKRDFIGGNCTVSLMLMAIGGLFKSNAIEWVSAMTYQAASGAGAKNMKELILQMGKLSNSVSDYLESPYSEILEIDDKITQTLLSDDFPKENFTVPLAGSLIPWIDAEMKTGQSKEEWKASAETNKILDTSSQPIPIDGTCVRIGAMRCHSQALTIKLSKNISIDEVHQLISNSNPWVRLINNDKSSSINYMSPVRVSGTLDIPVGRIRKMNLGEDFLNVFTVGDQLLWGAAEPLRRALLILMKGL
tara:strand:+ start:18170 stop:19288 length:1119 start_codon:yes stop_codon:yes gene_type:complete